MAVKDLLVVLTEQPAPRPAQFSRSSAQAMRQSFVRRRSHVLVLEPVPEIESFEVFILMKVNRNSEPGRAATPAPCSFAVKNRAHDDS